MSRRKNKHASHGGAWKVAYADFVTAMMALFIVLWLTSQDQKIKEAVQRSFRNPFASVTKESTGVIPNKDVMAVKSTDGNFDSAAAVELNMLRRLAQDLLLTLHNNPEDPEETSVTVEVTAEGLRINVFDRNRKPVFQPDTAEFTPYGAWIFSTLAWEIARYTNGFMVELEGHTERGRAPRRAEYGNWELSADRANAARRRLIDHDVSPGRIRKVAGFADTLPLPGIDPHDATNRRVAVLLKISGGTPL